jgi:hypothetical protein
VKSSEAHRYILITEDCIVSILMRRRRDMCADLSLRRTPGPASNRYEAIVLCHSHIPNKTATMTRIREEDFTIEYVLDKGIFEAPCVVTNRLQENNEEDVDVTSGIMLPTTMNLNEISEIIGELTEVKLIDVETQTEVRI